VNPVHRPIQLVAKPFFEASLYKTVILLPPLVRVETGDAEKELKVTPAKAKLNNFFSAAMTKDANARYTLRPNVPIFLSFDFSSASMAIDHTLDHRAAPMMHRQPNNLLLPAPPKKSVSEVMDTVEGEKENHEDEADPSLPKSWLAN